MGIGVSPKGISEKNRQLLATLHRNARGPFNVQEAAELLALSIPRAHRFLAYLAERWGLSRHETAVGREGVVLKSRAAYAKEKCDLPQPAYVKLETGRLRLPPLPEGEVMGTIAKVHADLGADFKDKTKAMPLIARYIAEECAKGLCSKPAIPLFTAYNSYLEGLDAK